MSTWKTFLAVVVIFLAGLLTGGALIWKFVNQSDARPVENTEAVSFQPWQLKERYVGYLAKRLELSLDQKIAISQIVTESQQRTKILFELVEPEMREEMRQVRDAIRAVLTLEQQNEFDEIQKRHGRHRKESDTSPDSENSEGKNVNSGEDALHKGFPASDGKCQNDWLIENIDVFSHMKTPRCG